MVLPTVSIRDLESECFHSIDEIFREDTQYGEHIVAKFDDFKIILPRAFNQITDNDLHTLNHNNFSIYKNEPEHHWGGLAALQFEYHGKEQMLKELEDRLNSISDGYKPTVPIDYMLPDYEYRILEISPVMDLYYSRCRLATTPDCYVHLPEKLNHLDQFELRELEQNNFSIVKATNDSVYLTKCDEPEFDINVSKANVSQLRQAIRHAY